MIVFTAGLLKVKKTSAITLFEHHQILYGNGSNRNIVIYIFIVMRLRLECHHLR